MGGRRVHPGKEASIGQSTESPNSDVSTDRPEVLRHLRDRRRAPFWLKLSASIVSALLVASLALAAILFLRLQGNIKTDDLNAALGGSTAPAADDNHDPIQILILGTDTRSGANSSYGSQADSSGNGNSDVMMLLNLSADRKNVSIVSFPRDLMVPFPGCKNPAGGNPIPAQDSIQLNSALALGGPGCTVATINAFTGLTIDHFMLADFTAVKDLTSALGGVEVCVSKAVKDPASGLDLPAGKSSISGDQALAFLRTRHAFGNAGDTDRIKAQQAFLASMTRKIKSEGTLTDLPKLYNIADIVTRNLTVDSGLASPTALITMAGRLKDIDLSQVAFVTVPSGEDPADTNRLILSEPAADQLFSAIKQDVSLTTPAKPSSTATASTSASASPSASSSSKAATTKAPAFDTSIQPVIVSNASGVTGRDQELLQSLSAAGYTNSVLGQVVADQPNTQILYGTGFADVAQSLATLYGIPSSALRSAPALSGVQLMIGQDFSSGTKYGKVVLPKDIVAETAGQPISCQEVNDLPR
ncbi:LCP family protein required for cell wall assembly [Psychromicrobium silvestre]|uniref:LCP family protein required for cell wall assembly n=1 Tax=Psychromicrobium silvestre TaxID=1645614 RepID=A0A7Y9S4F9_9MICC|nr:LCP family protein [Psychromicrobium silvestre]NYE94384.1 LCP family protein required for cell wall assembly [Psychromicrobium silvestre]